MTGCSCLLLIGVIVGLIAFMIFGSTDPGEPVEQLTRLVALAGLAWMARVPIRRRLVRLRHA